MRINRFSYRPFAVEALVAGLSIFLLFLSQPAHAQSCPWHCSTWFDGCNRCDCVNGRVENCDKAGCVGEPQRPRCLVPESASADKNCKWYGTAPFCRGECPIGYHEKLRNVRGDGKQCSSGTKAYCCPQLRVSNSPAYCLKYAQRAIDQYERAVTRGCRISGPEWNPSLDHHFDWCLLSATQDLAQRGDKNREILIVHNCRN